MSKLVYLEKIHDQISKEANATYMEPPDPTPKSVRTNIGETFEQVMEWYERN